LKILITGLILSMALMACSSTVNQTRSGVNGVSASSQISITPIKDQRLAESEFKTKGVRIYYTLLGNVEAIEATGYAAVVGNSASAARESYRVAELEAKKSLSDFINQEAITSTTSIRMISQNLERAEDKTSTQSNSDLIASDSNLSTKSSQDNSAVRNDALKIASTLQTTITTQNKGILAGLYLKESAVLDGGRSVMVVMRWDQKHNDSRKQIRNLMAQ
jgi:hypothetical protein